MSKTLVIGGGPSGLAAAYAKQGDTIVLEKEQTVGGLCRSVEHDGGVFDIGGHSFHTPFPEVYELVKSVLEHDLFEQTRDARVFTHRQVIPYPFQKHFDQINDERVVQQCAEGLKRAKGDAGQPGNFEEFIVRRFGDGIAEHFMLPYNRKLWAREISGISCEWTSERVAGAKGDRGSFLKNGGERKPLQSDTKVAYPARGGFQEIFGGLAKHVPKVETNCAVARVDPKQRLAYTEDGRVFEWDELITTMPIPEFLRILDGATRDIIERSDELEYMSLRVQFLLIGCRLDTIQRLYVADKDVPPHKIAFNHNSSQHLRERPCHAIMAEVSYSEEKPLDEGAVAPKTIEFLVDMGILQSPRDVVWTGHKDIKFAYPVYTHKRVGILRDIKDWLSPFRIHTLGRFGDWEYVNSDKCVMKGLKLGYELRET